MTAKWQEWSARFAEMPQRERAMVFAAVVFGLGLLGHNFAVEPALLKSRNAAKTVQHARAEISQLQTQLAAIASQNADPDAPNRVRLDQVRQQMAVAGGRLQAFEAGMVPPEKMQVFLESLLTRNRNLELLGLKTLPVTQVGAPEKKVDAPEKKVDAIEGIYQHGVEIRLAGSYNDLLNYLAELESMPQRVMWNSVSLTVDKYPRNILTLRIYTLSLNRTWLVV
ncbi:MAG: hypothetical protein Q8O25_00790 [Sulfurisoma sp.]|nr:hypothetical protein [Sulfurisoma sp.]